MPVEQRVKCICVYFRLTCRGVRQQTVELNILNEKDNLLAVRAHILCTCPICYPFK